MNDLTKNINLNEIVLTNDILDKIATKEAVSWVKNYTEPFRQLMVYYKCAMMSVETKFRVLSEEYSLSYSRNPIQSIKTRLKSFESIFEKLGRKGFPRSVESLEKNLNDVAGVRVICSFPEDVYMLADALLQQDDVHLLETKDYIKNPKPNGYRSLHLIVEVPIFLANTKKMMKVEIQLRTIAMDFWATLEHQLKYKKHLKGAETISDELYRCAEISAKLDTKMDEIRKTLESINRVDSDHSVTESLRENRERA